MVSNDRCWFYIFSVGIPVENSKEKKQLLFCLKKWNSSMAYLLARIAELSCREKGLLCGL